MNIFKSMFRQSAVAAACLVAGGARICSPARWRRSLSDTQGFAAVDRGGLSRHAEFAGGHAAQGRVMPPELRPGEGAEDSGLNDNHDVDAAGVCRVPQRRHRGLTRIIGVAQGQFAVTILWRTSRRKSQAGTSAHKHVSDGEERDAGGLPQPDHDGLRQHGRGARGTGCARWPAAEHPDQQRA